MRKPFMIHYRRKTLDEAQVSYLTIDKEMLPMVFAIEKFYPYLLGSKVVVFTNHFTPKHLIEDKDAKLRLI